MAKNLIYLIPVALMLACNTQPSPKQKKLFLPEKVWKVPEGNDYDAPESEFSKSRMKESPNLAAFWSKDFGDDPMMNPDSTQHFDMEYAMAECERFYDFYVNELKFVQKGKSVTDSLKTLIYIISGEGGTAFGGGSDDKIGILWTPPSRMSHAPYGALAHELGHAFQYLVHADGHWGFTSAPEGSRGQAIFEMTSQYMLWQVYPEWMTFENYHLKDFMKKTHYAFLHETNQYHSPYVLEYWAGKHGKEFIGQLWREAKKGEDPVMAYQRITGIDQKTFNDEIFDASRRFITWDLPRVDQVASPYANQHYTSLSAIDDNWYQIAAENTPQNYGYNGIKLAMPDTSEIVLEFKGIAGAEGYRAIKTDKAGWRYGFLAVKENGEQVYGPIHSDSAAKVSFAIPENTEHLWLVVSGAPTSHWEHLTDGKDENDEQWPYQIRLTGTAPTSEMIL
jgi:hypothetical protein